jgi:hypothetical protein
MCLLNDIYFSSPFSVTLRSDERVARFSLLTVEVN